MKKFILSLILGLVCLPVICAEKKINLNSSILDRFDVEHDDFVFDKATRLTWQTCSVGQMIDKRIGCSGKTFVMTWDAAKKLEISEWRLPTKDELATIIDKFKDRDKDVPRIHQAIFYNIDKTKLNYWTSTTADDKEAWYINFGLGPIAAKADKNIEFAVRLVKGTFMAPAPEIKPPKDIYEFMGRRDDCNHFAGEFSGMPSDRARDRYIDKTMAELRCNSVEADEKKLRKKYQGKADMLKWLNDRRE